MTIKQKQWQLYFLGYYFAGIDGIWGPASEAATKAFQKDFSLEADGDFGPLTEAKSMEVVKGIQKAVGADVDGLAGPNTVAATITYQRNNGLSPDGIAGLLTRGKIAEGEQVNWEEVKYFVRAEFQCNCGGKYCNGFPAEPKKKLVEVADRVRGHFGAAAIISSGVRCERHNANVGGVSNSRHLAGKAMDFRISGKKAAEVLAYAQQQPEIRYAYAIDKNYIHMDIE